ncbi:MAG: TonB-dependent receptor [Agriterribacter sp.]
MKKIIFRNILAVLLCLLYNFIFAQNESGKITGTVVTDDNKVAEGVTVQIVGAFNTSITNESGKFSFAKLSPGEYTLRISLVGHENIEKKVTVVSKQTAQVSFKLNVNASTLGEVVIVGRRNSLTTNVASGSLRTQTPLIELPQNVQVVTGKALTDQQVTSMSDGLIRNVSGAVRLEHWADMYTNIQMRGSQIQAFRNGFNVVASYWGPLTEDMSVVDKIEFVKGPAGFMLGNGDPSGLYNVVTKKPTGENKGEVSFTGGSYDFYRGTIDIDRKLTKDGKLLFRFNGAYQKKGSFRPFEHNDRIVAAPVLTYAISNKSKLTLEYTYQNAKMTEVGSYYIFSTEGFATLPRNFTLTQPGIPPTKINDHSAFLNFQHTFNNAWKLTAQAAYFKYGQTGSSTWPSVVNTDGTVIRNDGIWDAASEMTLGQAFINGDITTGPVRHRILAGIDAGKKKYEADWGQYHNLDTADDPFDIYHPDYSTPPNGFANFDRSKSLSERAKDAGGLIGQEYVSGYIQDELGFFNNTLRLTLAGRYGYVKQYEWGGDPYKASHFTPRAGLSYSVDKSTSFYVVYDQAFIPQAGMLRSGKTPKPITGNNKEIGFKKDWFDGKWNTTVAVYRILKENELTADPKNTASESYSIVVGEKRAQGIEFDLKGEIAPGFNAVVNYAYTDGKVTKVAEGVTDMKVGDVVPGFAKHTTNAWLSYTVQRGALKGFGINGGFTYLAGRAIQNYNPDAPNENMPDYFKLDGGLFWQYRTISVTLNAFNILNKYLYNGAYYTGYWNYPDYDLPVYSWQADPPRNFRVTVAYKF